MVWPDPMFSTEEDRFIKSSIDYGMIEVNPRSGITFESLRKSPTFTLSSLKSSLGNYLGFGAFLGIL